MNFNFLQTRNVISSCKLLKYVFLGSFSKIKMMEYGIDSFEQNDMGMHVIVQLCITKRRIFLKFLKSKNSEYEINFETTVYYHIVI